MIKKIGLIVVSVIAIILVLALFQPDSFRVTRSIAIKAAPEKIYPLITDFHGWTSWSPWEHLDPTMKRTFSGAVEGKGAIYEWNGNDKVGAGRMELTDLAAPSKAVIKLDFLRPMEGHNMVEFELVPNGGMTTVNWHMYGPATYMTKVMSIFVSMDKMVGPDFEKGLATLKQVSEK
jgi:hypothetical protein